MYVELEEDPHIDLNCFSKLPTWHTNTNENIKKIFSNPLQHGFPKQILVF
jgi:hypothetical protein